MKKILVCFMFLVSFSASSNVFIGDSIANGYKIASNGIGVTKVGASPRKVLEMVQISPADSSVVLSSGASNNCADIDGIKAVITTASAKFGKVYLLSAPYCGLVVNEKMKRYCLNNCEYKVIKSGSDGIHPKYQKIDFSRKDMLDGI